MAAAWAMLDGDWTIDGKEWQLVMLLNGLHAEFGIKEDESSEVEPVRDDEQVPGWVDQLDEAPPDAA